MRRPSIDRGEWLVGSIQPISYQSRPRPYNALSETYSSFVFPKCRMYDSTVEEYLRGLGNIIEYS
jgi:hypothetical protein